MRKFLIMEVTDGAGMDSELHHYIPIGRYREENCFILPNRVIDEDDLMGRIRKARNMDIDIDHDSTYDCIDILTASEPEPEKEEFEVWCHNIARTLNGFVNYGESIDRVVEGFRKMPKR